MKKKLLALRVLTFSVCFFAVGQVRDVRAQETPFRVAAQAARNNFVAGNYEDARKQYEEALALATTPKQKAWALVGLGSLSFATKDYVLARADLQQALNMEVLDKTVRGDVGYMMARSYVEQGDFTKAHEEFALYLEDTTLPTIARAVAQNEVAQMYADAKDFARARSTWAEMSVTLEDKTLVGMQKTAAQSAKVTAQTGVAQTFAEEKDFARAREVLAQAAVLASKDGTLKSVVQYELALSYVLEKNYAQARVEFNKVLTIEGVPAVYKAGAEKRLKMLADLDALVANLNKSSAQEAKEQPLPAPPARPPAT